MKSFVPFIVIGLSIGIYFVYISPTIAEVKTLYQKKAEYDNLLLKSKELKTKRDQVLQDYNSISEADITKLNKIIPDTFNAVVFANDLNTMISGYGLTIKDFKADAIKTELRDAVISQPQNQPFKTTAVSFQIDGQYEQFLKFLTDLESSLRLVDVVGLKVKPVGGKADNNFQFSLDVYTYSLR